MKNQYLKRSMFQSQSHATCGPCELETDSPPTSEWPWSWWSIYHDHVDTILIVDGFNQYKPLPDHSNAPMLPWLHLHKQNNTCIVFQHNIHDIYLKPLSYWLVDVCLCLVWCQTAWIISYDVSSIIYISEYGFEWITDIFQILTKVCLENETW